MTSSIKHWFWCLCFFSALTYWFWVNSSFLCTRGFLILFLISLSTHQKFWSDGSYAIRFGSLIKSSAVGGHQFRSGIKQIHGWLSPIFFDEISNTFFGDIPASEYWLLVIVILYDACGGNGQLRLWFLRRWGASFYGVLTRNSMVWIFEKHPKSRGIKPHTFYDHCTVHCGSACNNCWQWYFGTQCSS